MDQDDKFQLGNFSELDRLEDIDDLEPPETEDTGEDTNSSTQENNPRETVSVVEKEEGFGSVAEHPTEKKDPQPSFGSPTDGSPLSELDLERIVPNQFQPRRIFNQEKLQELAGSIKEHGIIQPIVVTVRDDGKYEIIVGERRFRAAKLAGLSKAPAFIRKESVTPQMKLEVALIENVQRADLNPIEEAKAYERLRDEFSLQVKEIAERVGKSASAVSNLMRLLKLPAEVQKALVEEEINEGQARPLLSLDTTEEILQMFQIIKRNDLKVRDIEKKVREIKQRGIKVREMFKPDPFLESLENILRSKLGTRVAVNKGAKGGKITIEFYSDDELNDLVEKLT